MFSTLDVSRPGGSPSLLWHINTEFEAELAGGLRFRLRPIHETMNRRLTCAVAELLAAPGDGILAPEAWHADLCDMAKERRLDLISVEHPSNQSGRLFFPWGRTPRAIAVGVRAGADVSGPSPEIVRDVNSKRFSHRLERKLGIADPHAAECATLDELAHHVAAVCPAPDLKWVVKHPFGVAARERVLGRGPTLGHNAEAWCRAAFQRGDTLLFEPWLEVIREYGTVMHIAAAGGVEVFGVSDVQANGAGTATGYLIGRPPTPQRMDELLQTAREVGKALHQAGYWGPCGIDALEHRDGWRPVLEINARLTVGFLAVAAERRLNPAEPTAWSVVSGQ